MQQSEMQAALESGFDQQFLRFEPGAFDFPSPRLPVTPRRAWQLLPHRARPGFRTAHAGADGALFFTRARYALFEALRCLGVGPNAGFLAPSYHCRTMLDPAIALAAPLYLYEVLPDLTPDLASVEKTLQAQPQIRCVLVPHYFGFVRDLSAIKALCEQYGVDLIEDCSHALFGGERQAQFGRWGRFAIASPPKFFPCADGGLLWGSRPEDLHVLRPAHPGLKAELRGVWQFMQNQRQPAPPLSAAATAAPENVPAASADRLLPRGLSHDYNPALQGQAGLAWSRAVMHMTDVPQLVEARRRNYKRWVDATSSLAGCVPLLPTLAPETVPYMFPLRLLAPETVFFRLKRQGLPVWRWDDLALSHCRSATQYRLELLHLPCHQELQDQHMDWMLKTLQQALNNS
ncbi:DegT/DnrJ/EryC1/StrS family aminotransferase [Variovorax sp. HJSM1_2]|uniref:DegT/DnrJ/EryC1/StrS family aminotransferase n=1 Tax=Variovorax sp. HJSM1_2 TaxID=3366263 RepID=UPI003BEC4BCA